MTAEKQEKPPEHKLVNMIWANELGRSLYIYEAEHGRCEFEIHGVVNDYETVLATATIEKHNRERLAKSICADLAPADGGERVAKLEAALRELETCEHPMCLSAAHHVCSVHAANLDAIIRQRALSRARPKGTKA